MITVGTILRGSMPQHGSLKELWVRVIQQQRTLLQVRITPKGATSSTLQWIERGELELAMRAGMLEIAPATITCEACGGRMRIQEGSMKRQRIRVWACRECNEVQIV